MLAQWSLGDAYVRAVT